MHYRFRFFPAALALALVAFFCVPTAQAQNGNWQKIFQVNPYLTGEYISCSYFFNSMQGVIGLAWNNTTSDNGMVLWTQDGGNTWTGSTIPAEANNDAPIVRDIWFKDKDTGWLVLGGTMQIGEKRLWKSIDGGKTWNALPSEPQFTGPASVRQTNAALCVTEPLGVGIWISTDEGTTWTSQSTRNNGLAFNDAVDGVATEYRVFPYPNNFLYTTNGGLSWLTSPGGIDHEAFGVYPVKHSKVYVCAPEDTMLNMKYQRSPVLRSKDNGLNWYQSAMLPMMTTGGIAGVDGVIYVQNSGYPINGAPHGLLRSIDSGQTWYSVSGPNQNDGNANNNIADTRFSVAGCGDIVFASDGAGGLWKTIDGGDSTTIIPQCVFVDSDVIPPDTSLVCDTEKHLYFLHNFHPNPGPVIIQDIRIVDSTLRPVVTSAFYFDSLPTAYTPIPIGDSVAYGLAWHPGAEMDSTAGDSLTIRVVFNADYLSLYGLNPYDTVYLRVSLQGLSTPADDTIIPKKVVHDSLPICSSIDTIVMLVNRGCDSLAVNQAYLVNPTWTLSDAAGNPLILPIHLAPFGRPGDTLRFRLIATPTTTALLNDSLAVKMHYEGHDTSFSVFLSTSLKAPKNPDLALSTTTLNFDSVATCDTTENPLSLSNPGCDTLTITKADLADLHFVLLDTNGNPLPLPIVIPPDSMGHIFVRFIPTLGKWSATVTFHYHRSIYSAFDGTTLLTLGGVGVSSGKVSFPDSIDFGTVPICGPNDFVDTIIYLRNSACDTAQIKSLSFPAPFVLVSPISFPQAMPPGSPLAVHIHYVPTRKGRDNGAALVQSFLDNVTTNGTIPLVAIGTSGASTFQTVFDSSLAFSTLNECDLPDSNIFTIVNPDCDTVQITSITLDPSLTAFTTYSDAALPAMLTNNSALHVVVRVSNFVAGTYSGNLNVKYTLADGTVHDTAFLVSIVITAGGGTRTLSAAPHDSLSFPDFHLCNAPDTTITFTYSGCGSIVISDSIAGTGFVLTHSTPSVSTGESFTDTIRYDGSSTGPLSATVFIRAAVSSGAYDTIHILGKVVPLDTVHFSIALSQNTIKAGDIFKAILVPDISVPASAGLTSIQGIFEYPRNHFATGANTIQGNGVTVVTPNGPTVVGNMEQYSFTVNSVTPISLVAGSSIVSLPIEAMISDTVGGAIDITALVLDGNVPNFSNCVLTAAGLSATTNFQTVCGDSILIGTLNGEPLVTSEDPRPNPVTSESGFQTTVNLIAAEDGTVEVKLFNALGEQVTQDRIAVSKGGTVPYTFHLAELSAGSYYYELQWKNGALISNTRRGMFQLIK